MEMPLQNSPYKYHTLIKTFKKITKLAASVAQIVQCLPSKHEGLSSIPSTTKKKLVKITMPGTSGSHLSTWEAEIGRIMVQGQPWQTV
jgi:hypothetical protein